MANRNGNRIDVEQRLNAFQLGAEEQRLLVRIWSELEPRLDEVMAPMRARLEWQQANGVIPQDFDVNATMVAMTKNLSVHYGRPVDEQWMKISAGVGNWITENNSDPYGVIALMQLSFARAQIIAIEGATDKQDRDRRLTVLGAIDHMACELAVARVNRIARYKEADRREQMAEQFRTTIADLVSATTRRSVAMSRIASSARASTRALVVDAADIASAAEQSAQVMSNAARESAQLVDSIDTTRNSVGEVSRVTTETAREADAAGEVISALNQHTSEITSVVGLIRNVADLTRMLALNATIEAAHAGDAGKGFAVVAQEVKALAAQTENATDEIVRQIGAIQSSGGRTVEANIAIAQSIGEVARSAASFQQAMESQSGQVTTIASMIDETAMTARAMADTVASIRTSAEAVDEQANNVEAAFGEVSERLAELETAVSEFLRDIAA